MTSYTKDKAGAKPDEAVRQIDPATAGRALRLLGTDLPVLVLAVEVATGRGRRALADELQELATEVTYGAAKFIEGDANKLYRYVNRLLVRHYTQPDVVGVIPFPPIDLRLDELICSGKAGAVRVRRH